MMKKYTSNEVDYLPTKQVFDIDNGQAVLFETTKVKTKEVFNDIAGLVTMPVPGYDTKTMVAWGADNQMPYDLIDQIESDEVMSQNQAFAVKTQFGQGIRFFDRLTNASTTNADVNEFAEDNSYSELYAAQCYDLKYFYFSLDVVILSNDGKRIARIVHKKAENVRLAVADSYGRINEAYYCNFRPDADTSIKAEIIPLLDSVAPWHDLAERVGVERNADGLLVDRGGRKFGILSVIPVPGSRYYPIPHYAAVFKGGWLKIKKLIQQNLEAKLLNVNTIRYHVEVSKSYWDGLFRRLAVKGNPAKEKEAQLKKMKEIADFLSNKGNSGKTWISEYYINPNGKEERDIRINTIDTTKEGGEWADDIAEACNMLCYACGIHPNLVGAVPGKSQTNNSGSDKRELFTLMQSIEALNQQVAMKSHKTVLRFNGWWQSVGVDVPFITLTTLDNHVDAVTSTAEK